MKLGIVTDSTASLNLEDAKEKGIRVVPLTVIVDGKSFTDQIDIDTKIVFEDIDKGMKVTSSQPSPQAFIDAFEEMKKEGYTDVVLITCSSALSGTFQSGFIASGMVEGLNVEAFDSMTSGFHLEMYIDKAYELIEEGKDMKTVLKALHHIQAVSKARIVIDELDGLVRGGRISKGAAMVGTMMKLKPIITLKQGELDVIDKIRTKKKAIAAVVNTIKEDFDARGNMLVHITHIHSIETSNLLRDKIQAISKDIIIKQCEEITPVLAVHFGRGGFGVSWYPIG